MAHTPGPWKYSPCHIEEGPPVVLAADGWIIATTSSDDDARLIAAAPDLLEALEALTNDNLPDAIANYEYMQTEGNHAQLEQAEYSLRQWEKARAAIVKARGEFRRI